jgi:hypothetical protein
MNRLTSAQRQVLDLTKGYVRIDPHVARGIVVG